jgi:hypothetical protein
MYAFTISHQTLHLQLLYPPDVNNFLIIACIEPMFIHGPTLWQDSNIQISVMNEGDRIYRVIDHAADVEIRCGEIEVKETGRAPK